jgi:uncharacterized protein YjbI with pentapeptide repeats
LVLASVGILASLALLAVALFVLPQLLVKAPPNVSFVDRAKAENDARGNLVAAMGVLAVLTGAVVGFLNFRETRRQNQSTLNLSLRALEATRSGQAADRFPKSIELLGHPGESNRDIRTGAIFALEQIARASAEMHGPVMEILAAFLREHGRRPTSPKGHASQPPGDLQAIVTVIGRRDVRVDPPRWRLDLHQVELRGFVVDDANLAGAILTGTNLEAASLRRSHLERADLTQADLRHADLSHSYGDGAYVTRARLDRANLSGAHFEGATFTNAQMAEAQLVGAMLARAVFSGTSLSNANLLDADLRGADLYSAVGLTFDQWTVAKLDDRTRLPSTVPGA